MSRVVIDARESGTSTGRYVDKLLEHLAKLKPAHEIIVLTKSPRVEFIKKIAPKFRVLGADYKEFTLWGEQIGLCTTISKLRPDLVHFTMPQQPLFYLGRSVTTMHDLTTIRYRNPAKNQLVFSLKQQVYKGVIFLAARRSKKLLATSSFTKQEVADFAHVRPDKIRVTYEAADKIAEPAEPLSPLESQNFLLYVGRPQPHKNLERLAQAFGRLQKDWPALKLVLAGKKDALYERLETELKADGIDGVVFPGFVSEGQLRWLYENCSAYVFPSLSEGFGLPGLEAMAHGAPVVSSDATCLPEIYGQAAHYFKPEDVDEMAEKITEVLGNENLRTGLIKKGRAQAAKYSWDETAKKTLEVYEQALTI